jgi:hypothetical protein
MLMLIANGAKNAAIALHVKKKLKKSFMQYVSTSIKKLMTFNGEKILETEK